MKITDVEVHEIHPPLCAWNGDVIRLYLGDVYDTRTMVILHTDNGLEGIGELGGSPNAQLNEELEKHNLEARGLEERIAENVEKLLNRKIE